jgi:hypothetical protein
MSPDDALAAIKENLLPQLAQQDATNKQKSALENAQSDLSIGGQNLVDPSTGKPGLMLMLPGIGKVSIDPAQFVAGGQGLMDVWNGVKQMAGFGGPTQDAQMADEAQRTAPIYAADPSLKAARVAGAAAPLATASLAVPALAPEAAAGWAASPLKSVVNSAIQGGVAGAVPYVPPGGSRIANAAGGAVAGAALQAPFSALQVVARGPANMLTAPEQSAVADMQNIPGYSPLPSQLTGNPSLRNMERVMGYFPFSSGQMAARTDANQTAVNAAGLGTLGAPEGSQFGTPAVLSAVKKSATDVMDKFQSSDIPVTLGPDHIASLDEIRNQAVNANTPNTPLVKTIDKLIGTPGEVNPDMVVGGRRFGDLSTEQQAALAPQLTANTGTSSMFPNGIPPDYFKSVQSDLSKWSADNDYLAGQANSVLTNASINSWGPEYQAARQQYHALMTAAPAFNPATGNLNLGTLSRGLSTGADELRYGGSSNPSLGDLASLANAGRGIPQPADANSATASNFAMQKLMGLLMEAGPAAGAMLGLHGAAGGGMAPEALAAGMAGAVAPFAAANFGAKAYLSPMAAQYAQQGIPSLADIMAGLSTGGAAAIPGIAGALQGP